jgi:hypothetical protein
MHFDKNNRLGMLGNEDVTVHLIILIIFVMFKSLKRKENKL